MQLLTISLTIADLITETASRRTPGTVSSKIGDIKFNVPAKKPIEIPRERIYFQKNNNKLLTNLD